MTLPRPKYLPKPVGNYRLVIFDPLGLEPQREFTRQSGALSGEVVASVSPLYGVKNATFSGDYVRIAAEGGEVAQIYYDDGDGTGWRAYAYGGIIKLRAARDGIQPYAVSADELIDGSDADDKVYLNADPAAIAFDLFNRCRHPAVRAPRASDFPASGIVTPRFDACGDTLGEAMKRLADEAAPSGLRYGYGLGGDGFPFFKPNTSIITLPYQPEAYSGLETDAQGLATAIRYVVIGEPSITPYAGAYQPQTLNYLAIPNAEIHARYRKRRSRDAPLNIFQPVIEATVAASGFSNTANPTLAAQPSTPAARTATTGTSYYALTNDDPDIYGIRLLYRMDDAVGTVKIRATAKHATANGPYYEAELPKSDQELKPIDIVLPPGLPTTAAGAFQFWSRFQINVPAGGTFEIFVAHLLRLDTERLEGMAILDTKLPARQPAQLAPRKRIDGELRGYLAPLGTGVLLEGTPWGDQLGDIAEYRFAFNPGEGVYTVIDLGTASRSGEAEQARVIKLGLARDLELQKIANARARRV